MISIGMIGKGKMKTTKWRQLFTPCMIKQKIYELSPSNWFGFLLEPFSVCLLLVSYIRSPLILFNPEHNFVFDMIEII